MSLEARLTTAFQAIGADIKAIRATAANAGGVIKQVEVNVGGTPVAEALATINDAAVLATTKVMASQAYIAATNKSADEQEMDPCFILALPSAGQITFHMDFRDGFVSGAVPINYQLS